jgi:fructokinase
MIYCIGEILLDMFGESKDHSLALSSKLGGAPFNVAANVAYNGGSSSFYGCLGCDPFGDFAAKEASRYGLKGLCLDKTTQANTTLAVVTIVDGERSFRFLRSPGADYLLDASKLSSFGVKQGDIVHFGSLMLSKEEGRDFIKKAIAYFRSIGALISFDANLRLDIFSSESQTKEIYEQIFPLVDILKLSEDELLFFYGKDDANSFYKDRLKDDALLFVSYGKSGSAVHASSFSTFLSSKPVKAIDTTGAGDAFYARVLLELDRARDIKALKAADFESILEKANEDGAKAVAHIGALPPLSE